VHLERWVLGAALLAGCAPEPTSVSRKARVVAKSGDVWARDLAAGLGLPAWSLCSELGTYDCVDEVHLVTLGGVEPEVLGVDQPLPNASVSAPIAVDRVATAACAERWKLDKAGPAVVFGPILERDWKKDREAVSQSLIRRLLSRDPTEAELEALEDLYDSLDGVSREAERTHDWGVGACVVVATSTEALFY
jgi:hypothetical protein